jgi:hypothetical protein
MPTWLKSLSDWSGLSGIDDLLGVPPGWRNLKRVIAVTVAFVAVMWPEVREALLKVVIALLSLGAAAWCFNLAFLLAYQQRFQRVQKIKVLLLELAREARQPIPNMAATGALATYMHRLTDIQSFLHDGFDLPPAAATRIVRGPRDLTRPAKLVRRNSH